MKNKITNPNELRSVLLHCIEGVMEGRINVPQANAIADLSAEIHKSIKLEWDIRIYSSESIDYESAILKKSLEDKHER